MDFIFYGLWKGGSGSGNFGHEGRPGEVGGSGEGGQQEGGGSGEGGRGSGGSGSRAEKAKASYKPATAEVQRQGEKNQKDLASRIKGKETPDNDAFDIIKGDHAIEVKTIVRGANDKITMHPESLSRKMGVAKENGYKTHTVVFDDRAGKIYYKEGLGSFRLSTMKETTLTSLKRIF